MSSIIYTICRGNEEYELDLSYTIEAADPSVGIMSSYAIFEGASIWLRHDAKWHPMALSPSEEADIEDWLQENVGYEPDYDEDDYDGR